MPKWTPLSGAIILVSAKYVPLYVAEFEFRYNNTDTLGTAVARC